MRVSATASTSLWACRSYAPRSTTAPHSTSQRTAQAPAAQTRVACSRRSIWPSNWRGNAIMHDDYLPHVRGVIERIRADGFYKTERVIASPQSAQIRLADGREVLNFCANNYLGLANDPRLIQAAQDGLVADGFGMASVRFICGTQSVHKELESALSAFLNTDD